MFIPLSFYQLIILGISLYFISQSLIRFLKKERRQSLVKFSVTITIWVGILIFTIFPSLAHYISSGLGMGENLNTLIFTGFIILLLLIFKLLSIIENIEGHITEIVRKETLREIEKLSKKNH